MRERPTALCSGDSNTPWWRGSVTIMEAYRSVIMEAFRDRFTAAELLSYKEVLYDEATEWYAPYVSDEVKREERKRMRLARQFYHLVGEYRERVFTYVLFQSPTQSAATHLESYLLHVYNTSQLDNDDDKEIDQLDWITCQRDYMQNRACCESRTSIHEAMQCNLVK